MCGRVDRGVMRTQTPHINRSASWLALFIAVVAGTIVAVALTVPPSRAGSTGYNWPVKPFTSEHPVRGIFGDPRTIFAAPPTADGVLSGDGEFQFHFGIDVSARDGTSVYAVVSGTVSRRREDSLVVSCGGGRTFEYWHVTPAVGVGSRVTAYRTVLGRILRGSKHVHLSELLNGVYVNPLQAGHLTPYEDHRAPTIVSISAHTSPSTLAFPNLLRGSVDFVVEAYDIPNRPVPGIWRNMPVSPTRLTWRVNDMRGAAVVPNRVAVDFRTGIPSSSAFWSYYARGSYQNMSVFGKHYSYRQPGRYLYRLSRAPLDTRTLKDGVYDLVVTATDIRGNSSHDTLRFTVHNRPGWIGS